jgi:hypothetical protein
MAYTDEVNLLGDNIDPIKKNTETLIDASKEINVQKTKYMLLSHRQNMWSKSGHKNRDRRFENETQLKYLRTTVTNQNLIQEEIKWILNSGNACYHSVQNLLSSCLLSKNLKIRINKTIILPVVLYGFETWSLTLKKEQGAEDIWTE